VELAPRTGDRQAELGHYFIARLDRLAHLKKYWHASMDEPPPELLDYAISSTYLDCMDLGLEGHAQHVLESVRGEEKVSQGG